MPADVEGWVVVVSVAATLGLVPDIQPTATTPVPPIRAIPPTKNSAIFFWFMRYPACPLFGPKRAMGWKSPDTFKLLTCSQKGAVNREYRELLLWVVD